MHTRLTSLAFSLVLASGAAFAGDGIYGQIAGGGNHERDQDLGPSGTIGFDDGGVGSGSLGYTFMNGWRPEVEYAFRQNDVNGGNSGGNEKADAAMANLWYDFHPQWFQGRLHPYLGGGAGDTRVRMDQVMDASGLQRDGADNVFAYQGGAGIDYEATRHLVLTLGYRYLETNKGHFAGGSAGTPGTILTPGTPGTAPVDARYRSDGVLAGLRYAFGGERREVASAAPAAAADAAEVVPAQAEVASLETVVLRPVNFQLNKAELTEASKSSLDEVAQNLSAHKDITATIEGYTDSYGALDYNKQLGEKRAQAVRDYLVSKGVDAASLKVASGGPQNPVAENTTQEGRAKNRRAEINPQDRPKDVKIVIEAPTPDSVEAAKKKE